MVDEARLAGLMHFIAGHPGVTQLGMTKLWKLLYFIDVTALRELGHTLTGSDYIKHEHGPVPSRGDKIIKRLKRDERISLTEESAGSYKLYAVRANGASGIPSFAPAERDIVERVIAQHGRKSAGSLSALSHLEPAWILAGQRAKLAPELMAYGASEDPDGL